jgi:hypothetical protein
MFDGHLEIRRSPDKMVIMKRWEDDRVLKLKGTYARAQKFNMPFSPR